MLLLNRFSHVRLCVTPQTAPHQAPLSLGFSRQEYWSGLPFSSSAPFPFIYLLFTKVLVLLENPFIKLDF